MITMSLEQSYTAAQWLPCLWCNPTLLPNDYHVFGAILHCCPMVAMSLWLSYAADKRYHDFGAIPPCYHIVPMTLQSRWRYYLPKVCLHTGAWLRRIFVPQVCFCSLVQILILDDRPIGYIVLCTKNIVMFNASFSCERASLCTHQFVYVVGKWTAR